MKSASLAMLMAVVFAACSDGTGPGRQVTLSFSGGSTSAASAAPGLDFSWAGAAPLTDGVNTLDITSAEVILREIELKRVEVADCDVIPEPDSCEKFESGPMLIDVPLDGSTAQRVAIEIAPGMYDEIEFDIHKLSGNAEDAVFLAAHPDLEDTSIRVRGTFNGVPFTYVTDLMEVQKFDLVPALVIDENTPGTNITIRLDVAQWFRDGLGNLVDPATANKGGENENLVTDNIRNSIDAFEDADRDGDES